jgi:hypothetical protein
MRKIIGTRIEWAWIQVPTKIVPPHETRGKAEKAMQKKKLILLLLLCNDTIMIGYTQSKSNPQHLTHCLFNGQSFISSFQTLCYA